MTPIHIDGIIRIKNAYNAGLDHLVIPGNSLMEKIVSLLQKEGRIADFTINGEVKKTISINLKYVEGRPVFTQVKLYSKPGRKIYTGKSQLKPVKGGKGLSIVSTPKGLMTEKQAVKAGVGGELLISLW